MNQPRAPLQLLPAPEDREPSEPTPTRKTSAIEPRRLAPGAPMSPGPVPFELATELRAGEPVVWWGRKSRIDRKPIAWLLIAGLLVLGFATLLAPELWDQPWTDMWKPLIPALAPAALLTVREWLSLRDVVVTDSSILVCDHRGRLERLAFRNVRRVARDLLTGGILLEGAQHKLRLPPALAEDARAAIATQTRHTLRADDGPVDPLSWLP
ncbi:hypothetical protein [Enhygromyxa salina]|uniref:Uncharacterized protein n=1 Tax=Enhygromyxa salina TaxID=215803 RepID=A0A2S9Y4B4_9BACT|nr:hypothetical protein [Enhygromyxa salina]PRP99936.1 hypothetical protein ENSA7_61530 [Enhygromyxa salina]